MLALPPQTAFPKAKAEAAKAIELDDTSAEAHAALGAVSTILGSRGPLADQYRLSEVKRQFTGAEAVLLNA